MIEFQSLADLRGRVYRFLSSIYLQPVSRDFTRRVVDKSLYPDLSAISFVKMLPADIVEGTELMKKFANNSRGKSVEVLSRELSVERIHLFGGISPSYGPPPPYEAVYKEGRVIGESTMEALRKYLKAGVRLSDECREMPDHIGIELGFMQFLCEREFKAWRSGKFNDVIEYLTMEREFMNEHMAKWIPAFCDEAIIQTKDDFYLGISKITRGFIALDQELIEDLYQVAKEVLR